MRSEETSEQSMSSALLSPVSTRRVRRGITTNRILSAGIFSIMVLVSSMFYYSIRHVNSLLSAEQGQIETLKKIIQEQEKVIERFNDTTTNAEVVQKVNTLQQNLQTSVKNMNNRIGDLETETHNLFNKTVEGLDQEIVSAKSEIHQEVEQVKGSIKDYARSTQDQFSMENNFMVYQLAGTFTVLGCLISMWHMTDHLRNMHQPFVQRKILAILWMCPIYSVTSWLSLVFVSAEGYLAIIKDFYEAYCIYTFLSFIIAVLGGGDRDKVVSKLALHADHLSPPFRLCGFCSRPREFASATAKANAVLLQCQVFAMQFVFLRPVTSAVNLTCNELGYYGGGTSSSDWRSPQFWSNIIYNISIFVAFSGLLKIYHAVHNDLSWYRPLPKFLCIKGVVFMTFWQGLAISILAKTTDLGHADDDATADDSSEWAARAQSFLICLEMLLFSIAHFYVFPTDEWVPGYRPIEDTDTRFGDNMALRDFASDFQLVFGRKNKKKKNKKKDDDAEEDGNTTDQESDEEQPVHDLLDLKTEILDEIDDKDSNEAERSEDVERGDLNVDNEGSNTEKQEQEDSEDDLNKEEIEEGMRKLRETLSSVSEDSPGVKEAAKRMLSNPVLLKFAGKNDEDSSEGFSNSDLEKKKNSVEDQIIDERASLIDSRKSSYDDVKITVNDDILRPSIFTTLAGMKDEKETDTKQKNP